MIEPLAPAQRRRANHARFVVLLFWLVATATALVGSTGLLNGFPRASWLATLVIACVAIATSRAVLPLTIIMLFNFLFSLYAVPHVFFEIDIVTMPLREGLPYLTQSSWVIALFVAVLMLWIANLDGKEVRFGSFEQLTRSLKLPPATGFFGGLLCLLLVSIAFGIKGQAVVGVEGGYSIYTQNLSQGSGLPEYLLVPLFVSGLLVRGPAQRLLWFLVLGFFVIKLSVLGLRVVALMGMLMGAYFTPVRLTFKRVLLVFFMGYLLVALLGLLKGGLGSEEIMTSLFFELHGDTVVSHHSNVLWASSSMLSLIDQGVIDLARRVSLMLYYAANSLIPSGLLQRWAGEAYFGSWLQEQGYTSGGGHAAVYAYVAAGIPGVLFIGSLLGWALKKSVSGRTGPGTGFVRCWFMMTLVTFPRWISYDLGNFLFRLPLYAAILYAIMMFLLPRKNVTSVSSCSAS
jgi:hypothetical protein